MTIQRNDLIVNQVRMAANVQNSGWALKSPSESYATMLMNSFVSTTNGALGEGDRGAFQHVPLYSGNPYDSQNYLWRWRQYVHLYEVTWEARKIVRIPVEDALRKPWEAEDLPEEAAKLIYIRLKQLNFNKILQRSLMLERLLGGCLTFFGVESHSDDPSRPLCSRMGNKLRFINAIPLSRISRMNWDTNPLSQYYMRPNMYLINGQEVDASRFLVWDGEPLFDPYDFALTNFRANLAGFGPSKLAPIWDDIVKAVGTRQAAYQLIQTNNSLILKVNAMHDLAGTTEGKAQLEYIKDIANQMSLYRAALIQKDGVDFDQHSASFGSVPELIITYLQVLSAASDIPATRFLGQSPGGLNATGESDLENYYNMIDSFQHERIEPALRYTYDIIGYETFPAYWDKWRENLTFKFPPLWNINELEEAQKNSQELQNIFLAWENRMISEEKVIEEINSKEIFSVTLDDTDIGMLDEFGSGFSVEPGSNAAGGQSNGDMKSLGGDANNQKQKAPGSKIISLPTTPKQSKSGPGANELAAKDAHKKGLGEFKRLSLNNEAGFINEEQAREIGDTLNCNWEQYSPADLLQGIMVELEHKDITDSDYIMTAKIAIAHLNENKDYYRLLKKYVEAENSSAKIMNYIRKKGDKYIVYSHSGKQLGEYSTHEEAAKRLRQIEYFKRHDIKNTKEFKVPGALWAKLLKKAQKDFCIHFDLENNEAISEVGSFEVEVEPGFKREVLYQMFYACGDWETPVLYFQCQYTPYNSLLKDDGCFIFIPGFNEGNYTLWRTEKGDWQASDDYLHKTLKENDKDAVIKALYNYLKSKGWAEKFKVQNQFIPVGAVDRNPSEAKKTAGNYKKHHTQMHGLNITIENPMGSERTGISPDGQQWRSILPAHYGYIRKTDGADGDHVDVYLGPHDNSEEVFVIDQQDADTQEFDEHKVIFGALGLTQAKALYLEAFTDGKAQQRIGAITPATVEQFKQWLNEGDTTKPYADWSKAGMNNAINP